jgi:predicted deacylase
MNEISSQRSQIDTAGNATPAGITMVTARGPRPGPTLVLLSGVHGDEWEGVVALGRICRLLHEQEIRGEVRLVSVCNEPAFAAQSRCAPEDGCDLARCFPGDPHGSLTERLAALVTERVIRGADFLIDLHSAGLHYTMPTLVGFTDDPSPVGRRSAEAAACFGAPVIWRHPAPPPEGRTISIAHALRIANLYVETTGAGNLLEADVHCYTHGVQQVMGLLDMLDVEPQPLVAPVRLRGSGDLDAALVRAHHAGVLLLQAGVLQRLSVGEVVGSIVNPLGEEVETLVATHAGVVVMLRHTPHVVPGDRICHLADQDE